MYCAYRPVHTENDDYNDYYISVTPADDIILFIISALQFCRLSF